MSVSFRLALIDATVASDAAALGFDEIVTVLPLDVGSLDSILAAVPVTTPVAIDPTGLTEKVVIPDGYPNVYVKTAPGVTIKRTASGFMLIVKEPTATDGTKPVPPDTARR